MKIFLEKYETKIKGGKAEKFVYFFAEFFLTFLIKYVTRNKILYIFYFSKYTFTA